MYSCQRGPASSSSSSSSSAECVQVEAAGCHPANLMRVHSIRGRAPAHIQSDAEMRFNISGACWQAD